ncbi:MAG: DUF805 domain-containing protein [Bacteroidota bacterium]
MEWFLKVVKDNYANFNGRAHRQEFWMFVLFNFIFSIVAAVLGYLLDTGMISTIYGIAVLVPSIAVATRRLHDIGKSGWLQLLVLIPVVGLILIYFWAIEGEAGRNEYGENPDLESVKIQS